MAEDLTDKELLHSGPGFRLFTGKDEAGEVYYERHYDLTEEVDPQVLAARVERLRSAALPGLAHIKEVQVDDSCLRIVQGEVSGANLKTLLTWEPESVTPDRFRKWAFEFCLFLRALQNETDWTPAPIRLDQIMVTPDDHVVVLAAGWEGLLKPESRNREAEILDQFRDFTTPLLEHMQKKGHEVSSLYWVFQHRCSCLDELRESLDQGAPFVPSSVDDIKPLDTFEVPEIEDAPSLFQRFINQPPFYLILQFSLLIALMLGYQYLNRPVLLPVQGVYALSESKIRLLEVGTGRTLGTLALEERARVVGLLEGPPRLAVAVKNERRVDILERSTGQVMKSILAEGPVTRMLVAGKLLCMNQGSFPGVLIYDSEQEKATRVLLTAPGVTSMARAENTLIVACREENKLYSFKLPDGELLNQRNVIAPEIVGSDEKQFFMVFDAGTQFGILDPTTLKTLRAVKKDPNWEISQILAEPDGELAWAFSPTNGCTLLDHKTLEPVAHQLQLRGKPGRALLLLNGEEWEYWIALPEEESVAVLGQDRSLKRKIPLGLSPSSLVTTMPSEE